MTSSILLERLTLNPRYFSGLKIAYLENIVLLTFLSMLGAQTTILTRGFCEYF